MEVSSHSAKNSSEFPSGVLWWKVVLGGPWGWSHVVRETVGSDGGEGKGNICEHL